MPFYSKYTGPLRTAARKKLSAVAIAVDAYFNYVTLLLSGDGTNAAQNNTFLDSSTNAFSITRNGNTTQGSFSPYGSNWSNYFDGNGDYLLFDDNAGLEIGTNSFTFEAWINLTAYSRSYGSPAQYVATVGAKEGTNGSVSYRLVVNGTSNSYTELICEIYSNDSTVVSTTASYSFALNTWYHVAAVRNGTTVTLYVNGTSIGSGTNATNSQNTSAPFRVGSIGYTNFEYYFPGYISNLRLVNGTAVYTSNFTPSTTPLTAITNTAILTCQSNRFVDNSTNNAAVTAYGNSSVQRFNPFGTSTAYDTSVIGGSGYFDGSGDNLVTSGTGSFNPRSTFTVEFWTYPITNNTVTWINSNTNDNFYIETFSGTLYVGDGSINTISATPPALNRWTHVLLSFDGTTYRLFYNGVSQATSTTLLASITLTAFRVGQKNDTSRPFNGYITDLRVLVGTALQTSAFTPPTAPLTAISNTSVLLKFQNAAIFDNAMMNDLETAGNAQISTSVVNYGTGSLAFDGTGDYLTGKTVPIGSGNLTIECWVYLNVATGDQHFVQVDGASDSNVFLSLDSGANKFRFVVRNDAGTNNCDLKSSISPSANTWYHIAGVISGGGSYLFVNGSTTLGTTGGVSGARTGTGTNAWLGVNGAGATRPLNGYLDDVRITAGYARYTANFTPPTAALGTISAP